MIEETELQQPFLPWSAFGLFSLAALALSWPWTVPQGSPSWAWLAVLVTFFAAESWAPRLAGLGRFPLSTPAFFVLLLAEGAGRGLVFLALLGALLIRWARTRHHHEPGLGLVSDYLPELAAVVLFHCAPVGLAPLAFWITWQWLPGLFLHALPECDLAYWSLARERSLALTSFLCACGLSLAWMFPHQIVPCLVILATLPLLSIPVRAQLGVLKAEAATRQHELGLRQQARASLQLAEMRQQVEIQKLDVELQQRLLTLVGQLFVETAGVSQVQELRPTVLRFVRKVVPAARVAVYENEAGKLRCTGSLGEDELAPTQESLWRLGADRLRAVSLEEQQIHHLAASIPERGLVVCSHLQSLWSDEQRILLSRLALYLPICLDAVRYRENQSRALSEEQLRRQELDRLAARLTAALDLLGQLVSCYELEDLISAAQRKLPELLPRYEVEVHWKGQVYEPPIVTPASQAQYHFSLSEAKGQLILLSASESQLSALDVELLRLFSSQFACLLDGAELNTRLRLTLDQLKESQAQLVQSSKMAAIGQLAAGVAHELNTPLGAISIAIELSRDLIRKDPERAITRLGRALESVEQMQSIISKLLSYSRDSRGLFAEVDLNGVVHSSFQLVEHTLKLAGVEAQLMPGPELTLMGNANELQQVFSNLLLNAKDACLHPQARKKRIEVWLESQPGQALVHLRDYGSGMDESTRLRIFDPFFTTKPIGEGTGLGLSTSLELIEQHGGKIAVKSNPGEGTHFVVSLPLEVSH